MAKRAGYLLIEMVIALAIAITMSTIIAFMQTMVVNWHKQAVQYSTATDLAMSHLALAQNHENNNLSFEGFTVTKTVEIPDPSVPYSLSTIRVEFKDYRGTTKHVTVTGGVLHARS